jgi:hypothetical protein
MTSTADWRQDRRRARACRRSGRPCSFSFLGRSWFCQPSSSSAARKSHLAVGGLSLLPMATLKPLVVHAAELLPQPRLTGTGEGAPEPRLQRRLVRAAGRCRRRCRELLLQRRWLGRPLPAAARAWVAATAVLGEPSDSRGGANPMPSLPPSRCEHGGVPRHQAEGAPPTIARQPTSSRLKAASME